MSTYNHTAIASGAAANAATINTPLGTLDAAIGNLAALTTTAKTSAVAAINEVDANADNVATRIGTAASSSGSIGTSIDTDGTLKVGAVDVAAVLVDAIITDAKLATDVKIGSLAALDTTAKSSVVAAINEVVANSAGPVTLYPILEPPTAFAAAGWTPLTIYQDAYGRPSLGSVKLLDFAPVGGTWYLDAARPDNSGDGLSWATAEKGINYAVQDANASASGGTIWVADGVYDLSIGNWTLDPTKNISLRALNPGNVVFSNHKIFSYALDGVYTNTYRATHGLGGAAHYEVRDALYVDVLGDYQKLTVRTSAADVDANAGSWYDDGTTLWVRLSDDRAPDTNLRPYWQGAGSTPVVIDAGSATVLIEGIRFEGGAQAFTVQAAGAGTSPTIYFVNCAFKYAYGNGLNNVGADTYCQNCLAAKNSEDGFHYAEKATAVRQARFMEIECVGRDNGDNVGHIDNGSTSHNASLGIRIGGIYYRNYGRNVHDVGSGKTWMIGCWAHDSADATNDRDIGCGTGGVNTMVMWLDHCRTGGSAYDLEAATGCTIYTRYCTLGAGSNTGAGTIAAY